jgi:hypothetical protein
MMNKILLVLVLVAFLFTKGIAQDEKPQKNGIRFGYHAASMVKDGSKPEESKTLSSFYAGFFRSKKLGSILHFDSGIEYFQNGLKYTGDAKRTLHTISIPLDLRLKIGPVYGVGGAAANFKVSESFDVGDNSFTPIDSDKSNWFDIAAFAGAGVKVWILSVEARYHWGLLEVRNDLYSRYFQIGAAVSF